MNVMRVSGLLAAFAALAGVLACQRAAEPGGEQTGGQVKEQAGVVDVTSLGPQVGERVPAFVALDQHGREQSLDAILGRRGAMLVFNRSADW